MNTSTLKYDYQQTIALPGETIIEIRIVQGNVFHLDEPARKILYGIIDRVREYEEHCKTQPLRHGIKNP